MQNVKQSRQSLAHTVCKRVMRPSSPAQNSAFTRSRSHKHTTQRSHIIVFHQTHLHSTQQPRTRSISPRIELLYAKLDKPDGDEKLLNQRLVGMLFSTRVQTEPHLTMANVRMVKMRCVERFPFAHSFFRSFVCSFVQHVTYIFPGDTVDDESSYGVLRRTVAIECVHVCVFMCA